MRKLKDLLENIHEWPAKHENHENFLSYEFPVIQVSIWELEYYKSLTQSEQPADTNIFTMIQDLTIFPEYHIKS